MTITFSARSILPMHAQNQSKSEKSTRFAGNSQSGEDSFQYSDEFNESPAIHHAQDLFRSLKNWFSNRLSKRQKSGDSGAFNRASSCFSAESVRSGDWPGLGLKDELYQAMQESPEAVSQVWKKIGSDPEFEEAMLSNLKLAYKSSNWHAISRLERFNAEYRQGQTVLHAAARRKDQDAMQCGTSLGFNVNAPDQAGKTALHIAIEEGASDQLIDFLLKHGADPNLKQAGYISAMDLAEALGYQDALRHLSKRYQ